jgi:hypothetical protein
MGVSSSPAFYQSYTVPAGTCRRSKSSAMLSRPFRRKATRPRNREVLLYRWVDVLSGDGPAGPDVRVGHEQLAARARIAYPHQHPLVGDRVLDNVSHFRHATPLLSRRWGHRSGEGHPADPPNCVFLLGAGSHRRPCAAGTFVL